jgi:hypothetical protein
MPILLLLTKLDPFSSLQPSSPSRPLSPDEEDKSASEERRALRPELGLSLINFIREQAERFVNDVPMLARKND